MRYLAIIAVVTVLGLAIGVRATRATTNYERARHVIYSIFPRATASNALRVVGCETGHTYYERSYNPSGAIGYFQILRGNGGRVLHYKGSVLVINAAKLFDPWYNAIVALFLSNGGTDWHEWTCQP